MHSLHQQKNCIPNITSMLDFNIPVQAKYYFVQSQAFIKKIKIKKNKLIFLVVGHNKPEY